MDGQGTDLLTIDWAFIGSLEGQSVLDGYVPDPNGSQSGVTVATGVDLGQMDKEALRALELPIALARKLAPYVGLKGAMATMALASMPLSLTPDEAATLDGAARYPDTHGLIERYGEAAWARLPDAAQTVLASVAFQYGPGLAARCPRFWAAACKQDWPDVIAELRAFGDRYPTRRSKEADYLESATM